VQRIEHDGGGKVVLVAAPVQFGGRAPQLGKAPAFGADTDDVLRAHGFTDDTIADLRSRRIIA
jgi:crotonobetainyl-CoA:carnitine CoA-transferase CaiB-like acyl-CoA transferase